MPLCLRRRGSSATIRLQSTVVSPRPTTADSRQLIPDLGIAVVAGVVSSDDDHSGVEKNGSCGNCSLLKDGVIQVACVYSLVVEVFRSPLSLMACLCRLFVCTPTFS